MKQAIVLACLVAAEIGADTQGRGPEAPAAPALLSGRFTQEKIIVGLKKPLVSHGDFLVARQKGVIWRTQKPFASAVAVTPKGIWSLKSVKGKGVRSPLHQGNLAMAMEMIQMVLAGEPSLLKQSFEVAQAGTPEAWTLDLKPLDPMVKRVITTVRLQGGRHAERVEYLEANGDRTHIDFADVAENAGELDSWQAIAFGG